MRRFFSHQPISNSDGRKERPFCWHGIACGVCQNRSSDYLVEEDVEEDFVDVLSDYMKRAVHRSWE
jgi:hypothetical protein